MSESPVNEDTQPFEPVASEAQDSPAAGGIGCWITGLITAFAVAVLVVAGLFLPPVDLFDRLFGTQFAALDAQNNAIALEGLTVIIDPEDPGEQFGLALTAVSLADFAAGNSAAAQWVPGALAAAPPFLAAQSNIYGIETSGTAPQQITLDIAAPQNLNNMTLLDLYGRSEISGEWRFIPSQLTSDGRITTTVADLPAQLGLFQAAPPAQSAVIISTDTTQVLSQDVAQLATIVAPAGMQPTLAGTLTGSLAPGFDLGAGYLVMPALRNFADPRAIDPETIATILDNPTLRNEHVRQITSFAASSNFDGVMIDYRGLEPEQRANFSAFMAELRASTDNLGLLLGAVVPAAENIEGRWETGAYDWRALGEQVDFLQINLGIDPTTFTPGAEHLVEPMLAWATGEVSRYKLFTGLSALSVRQAGGEFTTIGYDDALSALGDAVVEADTSATGTILPGSELAVSLDGFDVVTGSEAEINTPYLDYLGPDDTPVTRMWLTTDAALRFRMDRTIPFGLAGVAFGDLLSRGVANGVEEAILNYKLQLPDAATPEELALRWSIEGASGLVSEVTTELNGSLVATIEAPDGNYAINVAVVSSSDESRRGGAAVALFAPTLTPTPLPTATPSPTPTPIPPTPVPVVQQAAAPPANVGPAPAAPGAGSIAAGSFEYGGHVTSTTTRASAAMQRAGMNWMKVQLRYSPGMDPGAAAGPINEAHARGFKILLGVVGNPNDLAAGGQGYVQQFANFLGGVAGMGPDAIEVWNEQNLDREWPRGQISATAYTDMLRQAFQAIKSRNGSVMVISGAPAPTGAEGAFPGQVVNDNRYVSEMVQAGALQWMDCLGAHYNEGIVGPNQQSGDPRDNYYTRYFWGMVNTYSSITGDQKPICFTELGYLTPEGYPPLPGFFAWGQNTSVSEQAAWLAEAASLASQSGKVRLMIVWNVDFTLYGSDPQAGYAMIRPGGACPACDALAAAR